jgi:hypothetical protein
LPGQLVDFACQTIFEDEPDVFDSGGLLLQQHLPCDRLHLCIREWHADREPIEQIGKQLHLGERALPSAHDHHAAVELFGNGLDDLGYERRARLGVANILLHLVENEERAGQTAVLSYEAKSFLCNPDKLFGGNVSGPGAGIVPSKAAWRLPHLLQSGDCYPSPPVRSVR